MLDQTENVYNRIDMGSTIYQKLLDLKNKKDVSGLNRSNLTILPKPSDFEREMTPMPGTSKS